VDRTARTAFGEALKRGHLARNPVALARPPRVAAGGVIRRRNQVGQDEVAHGRLWTWSLCTWVRNRASNCAGWVPASAIRRTVAPGLLT